MLASAVVSTDSVNYCRYDKRVNAVNIHIDYTGAAGGETLTANLVRQDGWGSVKSATHTATAGSGYADFAITLDSCYDTFQTPVYRAHSGWYVATVGDGTQVFTSPEFSVTTVSVYEMRHDLCKGLPLRTSETAEVLVQPQAITGVSVTEVYPETFHGPYPLVYTKAGQTLSWAGGPSVAVGGLRWGSVVPLYSADTSDWIRVQVKPNLLPSADTTEVLFIDRREMTDYEIVSEILSAENWVSAKTHMAVEPRRGGTPLMQTKISLTIFYDYTCEPVHWS